MPREAIVAHLAVCASSKHGIIGLSRVAGLETALKDS